MIDKHRQFSHNVRQVTGNGNVFDKVLKTFLVKNIWNVLLFFIQKTTTTIIIIHRTHF